MTRAVTMITRWPVLLVTILALIAITLQAASANEQQQDEVKAAEFISTLGNEALAVLKNETLSSEQKESELVNLFTEGVDVDWIGRFVLGKYWRQTDDAQRERYFKSYRPFLIRSYTSRFTEYSDESFEIRSSRMSSRDEYVVESAILRPKAEPVIVNYRVRKQETGTPEFKVIDIIVEGVSLITTQRSEFNALINRNGFDTLVDKLEKRVAQFSQLQPALTSSSDETKLAEK